MTQAAQAIRTLDQLRADLPITQKYAYFQTGSYAPVSLSTQAMMGELLRAENESFLAQGGKGGASLFYRQAEEARQTVANLLGVSLEEVAWNYNTTTATRLAVQSIIWKPGDKLAMSDVEHASTFVMAQGMAETMGVRTTVMATGDGPTYAPDRLLDELDRNLTPDHRLLILCHVANTDGRRLPVAEAVRIARSRGVTTLIDGAQAVGVFPVDVGAIGADFYAGSGHKWLMGPAGVGFLVVNKAHLPNYNPHWMPIRKMGETISAASRSELGTPNHISRMGTAHSIANLQGIGLEQVEGQMRLLSELLRAGLREIPGVRNAGPDAWERSSSITTLQLEQGTPERMQQLVNLLRDDYQIVTKFRPEVCGVRVAIAAFNLGEEVEHLLGALAEVVPRIATS